MRSFVKTALIVGLLFIALKSSQAMGQFFEMENSMIGKPAKDFTLKTLGGQDKSMTKLRDGGNAIVFFWATWCPHCREQLKQLSEQGDEIQKKGIKVFLVDIGENNREVQSYVERNKVPFEVFLDVDSVLAEDYNVIGVPTFFFINKDGIVKDVEHCIPDNYEEIFTKG